MTPIDAFTKIVELSSLRYFKNVPGEVIRKMPPEIRIQLEKLKSTDLNPFKEDIFGTEDFYRLQEIKSLKLNFDKYLK